MSSRILNFGYILRNWEKDARVERLGDSLVQGLQQPSTPFTGRRTLDNSHWDHRGRKRESLKKIRVHMSVSTDAWKENKTSNYKNVIMIMLKVSTCNQNTEVCKFGLEIACPNRSLETEAIQLPREIPLGLYYELRLPKMIDNGTFVFGPLNAWSLPIR